MKNYITQHLLLRIGEQGYTLSKGVTLDPDPCFEVLDAYISAGTFKRLFFLPSCLLAAVRVGRQLGISAAAVIVCIDLVSANCLSQKEIQKDLYWPSWFTRKVLLFLEREGYISTTKYYFPADEPSYTLTIDGITCLLSGVPMADSDRMSLFTKETSNAYHDIIDYILSKDGMISLYSYNPKPVDYPEPYLPISAHEKKEKKLLTTDFFERLSMALHEYLHGTDPLSVVRDTIDYCRSVNENEQVYQGLDALGYNEFDKWQKGFFLLLCDHFRSNGMAAMPFSAANNPLGWTVNEDYRPLKKAAKSLVARGVVVMPPSSNGNDDEDDKRDIGDHYMLSPEAVGAVFRGRKDCIDYASMCRQADVIMANSVERKTLYFNASTQKNISTLRMLLAPESSKILFERLAKAGKKSLTCLFYGAPGVGKTELVRQLAAETGRDILVADAAKLTGCMVGDSEKNAREIFHHYKYLVKISEKAPILLFNEADGIISKRLTDVTRYNEKSENAVQGIILQEMEAVEGIVIATTNLELNTDEAMDRRWLYKIKFEVPDADIRAKIMKEKLPWLDAESVETLAKEFSLSGGQMDNVACKCIIEEFSTGNKPSLETLRQLCRDELSLSRRRNGGERKKIGFFAE